MFSALPASLEHGSVRQLLCVRLEACPLRERVCGVPAPCGNTALSGFAPADQAAGSGPGVRVPATSCRAAPRRIDSRGGRPGRPNCLPFWRVHAKRTAWDLGSEASHARRRSAQAWNESCDSANWCRPHRSKFSRPHRDRLRRRSGATRIGHWQRREVLCQGSCKTSRCQRGGAGRGWNGRRGAIRTWADGAKNTW
jgi:hypothetical protein